MAQPTKSDEVETQRGPVQFWPPATAEGVAKLRFGYAGANSVDCTDAIAMEVSGVEDGNVYLTKDSAEYLFWSLGTALGRDVTP